ncbi:hypothetical protein pdam_00004747 [Pocillopora damicornis]|uniref:Uncharacterized protein n=1 Tax=Pocillopora damicornis TaxID=46731 RepID=A0A3M6UEJ7_POCDA|nr:hypothetical protein pdam_00004747 [Pocillopora damicornis]
MNKAEGEDLKQPKTKMPEAARRVLLSTRRGQVCQFVKIGCTFFFDAVVAYGLCEYTGIELWFVDSETEVDGVVLVRYLERRLSDQKYLHVRTTPI